MAEFRPILRPGTFDAYVWNEVFGGDEYHVGDLAADDVVIDIGAHIGAFACAAYEHGSRRILAFEPSPENLAILLENTRPAGSAVTVRKAAIWRSDLNGRAVDLFQGEFPWGGANTGGAHVFVAKEAGRRVEAIPLDDVLGDFHRVALLKLDCEGSEFPILYTSRLLDRVQRIVGEFHRLECTRGEPQHVEGRVNDMPSLAAFLKEQDFEVAWHSYLQNPDLGHFVANRTN